MLNQTDVRLKKTREFLTQELSRQRQITKDRRARIKKVTDEIEEAVQSKNKEKTFYEQQMKSIYDRYVKLMSENKRNNQNPKGLDEI